MSKNTAKQFSSAIHEIQASVDASLENASRFANVLNKVTQTNDLSAMGPAAIIHEKMRTSFLSEEQNITLFAGGSEDGLRVETQGMTMTAPDGQGLTAEMVAMDGAGDVMKDIGNITELAGRIAAHGAAIMNGSASAESLSLIKSDLASYQALITESDVINDLDQLTADISNLDQLSADISSFDVSNLEPFAVDDQFAADASIEEQMTDLSDTGPSMSEFVETVPFMSDSVDAGSMMSESVEIVPMMSESAEALPFISESAQELLFASEDDDSAAEMSTEDASEFMEMIPMENSQDYAGIVAEANGEEQIPMEDHSHVMAAAHAGSADLHGLLDHAQASINSTLSGINELQSQLAGVLDQIQDYNETLDSIPMEHQQELSIDLSMSAEAEDSSEMMMMDSAEMMHDSSVAMNETVEDNQDDENQNVSHCPYE